jgi:hypothetical protein
MTTAQPVPQPGQGQEPLTAREREVAALVAFALTDYRGNPANCNHHSQGFPQATIAARAYPVATLTESVRPVMTISEPARPAATIGPREYMVIVIAENSARPQATISEPDRPKATISEVEVKTQ